MSEDLQLAAKVHYGFLPDDFDDDRLNIAISLRPLHALGGDYCSILPLGKDRILVAICDAVGHGVSAALFAARINTYILTQARPDLIPCDLVADLNAYLCKRLGDTGMYTTFYALLLDFESGNMSLTGAAHPPVLQLQQGQERCREWESIITYLGIADPMPLLCGSERLPLKTGDRFLIYSDGLIEVEDVAGQAFGIERLSRSFIAHRHLSGQALNQAILSEAESYAGFGFQDDVLLMSITLK
ncbi:PP2C family protein-serine/threonine phosphatase [Geopsychrobacter electrodiphilus]|uniref:PP2C family protein-serine/threonine phosphatase n=1 Tax=Geopsychrobacter electrodiphilus TaxID=225196 RepID=UPI00035CAD80|nr:PP2C family protein-serine/threonine phosphatase [Geopsychrobacter electrodiphilus]